VPYRKTFHWRGNLYDTFRHEFGPWLHEYGPDKFRAHEGQLGERGVEIREQIAVWVGPTLSGERQIDRWKKGSRSHLDDLQALDVGVAPPGGPYRLGIALPWKIRWADLEPEHRTRLEEHWPYPTGIAGLKVRRLMDGLVSLAGEWALVVPSDEDVPEIVRRGQAWPGRGSTLKKGQPSQCHFNVASLWSANEDLLTGEHEFKIATGYALSQDGLWRQHSWGLWPGKDGRYRVVETTVRRILYFGIVLDEKASSSFFDSNGW